jgi:hypothetical protein
MPVPTAGRKCAREEKCWPKRKSFVCGNEHIHSEEPGHLLSSISNQRARPFGQPPEE